MDSDKQAPRPIAHDVMLRAVQELGAKIKRVEINRWESPVFYADVVLDCGGRAGDQDRNDACESGSASNSVEDGVVGEGGHNGQVLIELVGDALALAARSNAPIYVEDEVMNRAGSISLQSDTDPDSTKEEFERFDEFVQNLSPDDF